MKNDLLDEFKPLQVEVRDSVDEAIKRFKNLVQKEGTLTTYKERSRYEKPSERKNRKMRESIRRNYTAALREKQILSGEWDQIQDRKEQKRLKKIEERNKGKFTLDLEKIWM